MNNQHFHAAYIDARAHELARKAERIAELNLQTRRRPQRTPRVGRVQVSVLRRLRPASSQA